MKINQVEELVGITKRNIRFYEKEGLLTPGRNSENGYREYGSQDVETLRQIKLLRKLGVPLEEIRRMQRGDFTLGDGLRRHIIQLERSQENLAAMQRVCRVLVEAEEQLSGLDAGRYLEQLEQMEREGAKFVNTENRDIRQRYTAALAAAGVFIGLMAAGLAVILWAMYMDPEVHPPIPLVLLVTAIPAVLIVGILLALFQRFREIKGGEEDAAAKY